jgi:hypothetical protein
MSYRNLVKRNLFLLTLAFLLFNACKKDNGGKEEIEPYMIYKIAISAEKCGVYTRLEGVQVGRMIKEDFDDVWHCSFLPFRIEGFECKDDYEYVISVRRTESKPQPGQMDYDLWMYTLVEVVSMNPVDLQHKE